MKERYVGHYENALRGQELATKAAKEKTDKIKEEYYKNPNKCKNCNGNLSYPQRKNKFCCSSCSVTFNNKLREGLKEETKLKISKTLKGRPLEPKRKEKCLVGLKIENEKRKKESHKKFLDNQTSKNCSICGKGLTYEQRFRKTCSNTCKIQSTTNRKYLNGSRKTIEYNGIILESTWEVKLAKWLDERKIKWIRPKPIKWVLEGKDKLYYPDFFLTELNLYLDPKNPYCMEKDKIKMEIISKKINIIFGDVDYVINKLGDVV